MLFSNQFDHTMNQNIDIPETLYHYTSLSGIEGILASKTLWMVNHKHQKDKDEIISHDDVIKKFLKENDSSKLQYSLDILFQKLKLLFSMGSYRIPIEDSGVYLTCFTNSYKNKTLWNDYADNHNGVVIEINTKKARITPSNDHKIDCASSQSTEDIRGMSSCERVDYLENVVHEQIKNLVHEYKVDIEKIRESSEILTLKQQLLLNRIYYLTYSLKLPSYQKEQEYRLFVPYRLETFQRLGQPQLDPKGRKILNFPLAHNCIEKIFVQADSRNKLVEVLNNFNLSLSLICEYEIDKSAE